LELKKATPCTLGLPENGLCKKLQAFFALFIHATWRLLSCGLLKLLAKALYRNVTPHRLRRVWRPFSTGGMLVFGKALSKSTASGV
jgi:hypothetical protein